MSERVEVRAGLAAKFKRLASECLTGVTKEKIEKASLKDLAIAPGIFADKGEALTGSASELFAMKMREHFAAVAEDAHLRALARGEQKTLDEVKRELAEAYPHTRPYLGFDDGGRRSTDAQRG